MAAKNNLAYDEKYIDELPDVFIYLMNCKKTIGFLYLFSIRKDKSFKTDKWSLAIIKDDLLQSE